MASPYLILIFLITLINTSTSQAPPVTAATITLPWEACKRPVHNRMCFAIFNRKEANIPVAIGGGVSCFDQKVCEHMVVIDNVKNAAADGSGGRITYNIYSRTSSSPTAFYRMSFMMTQTSRGLDTTNFATARARVPFIQSVDIPWYAANNNHSHCYYHDYNSPPEACDSSLPAYKFESAVLRVPVVNSSDSWSQYTYSSPSKLSYSDNGAERYKAIPASMLLYGYLVVERLQFDSNQVFDFSETTAAHRFPATKFFAQAPAPTTTTTTPIPPAINTTKHSTTLRTGSGANETTIQENSSSSMATESPPPSSKKGFIIALVVIGILGAIVAGVVGYVMYNRKSTRKSKKSPTKPANGVEEGRDDQAMTKSGRVKVVVDDEDDQ